MDAPASPSVETLQLALKVAIEQRNEAMDRAGEQAVRAVTAERALAVLRERMSEFGARLDAMDAGRADAAYPA